MRSRSRDRCLFAERCPHVMDRCWQARPATLPVREAQTAACYLYGDTPAAAQRVTAEVGE